MAGMHIKHDCRQSDHVCTSGCSTTYFMGIGQLITLTKTGRNDSEVKHIFASINCCIDIMMCRELLPMSLG
jgi:hypothetical protein